MLYIISILILLFLVAGIYSFLFYPRQAMPLSLPIDIRTPEPDKYHNDCLHPCIRFIPEGFCGHKWWMVQSPYYGRDSQLENPILYCSKDIEAPIHWEPLAVVRDTPTIGFNSDPTLFYEEDKLWIFWREFETPLCEQLGVKKTTVGCFTIDSKTFSPVQVFLTDNNENEDREQCPILIKKDSSYLFYAVHYQYKPERKSLGIAIWKGSSLENPDFVYKETTNMEPVLTCDKWKQFRIGKRLFFIPKPLKHDLWHFDLFEYQNRLYLFSVAEWGDDIMLSVSDDFRQFKTKRKPLVNTHYSENSTGYRQYFYKPTGFIENDVLYLYYTAMGNHDRNRNELFCTQMMLIRDLNVSYPS